MPYVFTDYLRSLATASEIAAPSSEVWEKLRSALVAELERRGLWLAPPSYLGIYGARSWSDGDALEELLNDCFSFVFIDRLPALVAQLDVKENVEGLIFLNLRHFLYGLQKHHDPLGFHVFLVAQIALRRGAEAGWVEVVAGSRRIGGDAVLGIRPAPGADGGGGELAELVDVWADALLPELVTARGKDRETVADRLGTRLRGLARRDVFVVSFQEIVRMFKRAVRERWNAAHQPADTDTGFEDGEAGVARLVPLVRPETRFEELDTFQKLITCVAERLERAKERPKTLEYLHRLWTYLRVYAGEPGAVTAGSAIAEAVHGQESLPSRRKLAVLLDIPRERLPGLHAKLGGLLSDCRADTAGPGSRGETMNYEERRRALGDKAAAAHARLEQAARFPEDDPRAGDVYAFETGAESGVLWVLVAAGEDGERWLAIAGDTQPLVGSADVEVPPSAPTGALSLRCRCEIWLRRQDLDGRRRVGRLPAEVLDAVRAKRSALVAGEPVGSVLERETDGEPEYQDWIEDLEGLRAALFRELRHSTAALGGVSHPAASEPDIEGGNPRRRDTGPERARRPVWARHLVLAASILLAVSLGFAGGRLWRGGGGNGPVANRPLLVLSVLEAVRGDVETLAVPSEHDTYWLVLQYGVPYPSYRLEILSRDDGTLLWAGSDMRSVGDAELTLEMKRHQLPSGDYLLRLYGLEEERSELLHEYKLRLILE